MVTYLAGGGRVQDSFFAPHKRRMAGLPAPGDGSSSGSTQHGTGEKIGVKMIWWFGDLVRACACATKQEPRSKG